MVGDLYTDSGTLRVISYNYSNKKLRSYALSPVGYNSFRTISCTNTIDLNKREGLLLPRYSDAEMLDRRLEYNETPSIFFKLKNHDINRNNRLDTRLDPIDVTDDGPDEMEDEF
jgi:hypothetical protein